MTQSSDSPQTDHAPYGYQIAVANTFEALLDTREPIGTGPQSQEFAGIDLGVEGLAEALRRWACVLLQARGGAGKSYTAARVRTVLARDGIWSVLVPAVVLADSTDLQSWNISRWAMADPDAGTSEGLARSEAASEGRRGLIVIDGLNEVDRPTGQRILKAIGPLTATNPQVSFLVTDRLTRRAEISRHWRYATLGLVPMETVRAIAGPDASDALRIPYYLSRHNQGAAAHEILRDSIARFVDGDAGLASLAEAAFDAYRALKRRSVTGEAIERAIGRPGFEELVAARCVIEESLQGAAAAGAPDEKPNSPIASEYRFEHHLLHDYLAGWHLAQNRALWNADGFDVATLKASSFDALALALAEITDAADAEQLVQSVYNWNYYAAAYMIEEDRRGSGIAGDALVVALLGALADKRFDGIIPTADRVEDALRVNQVPLAQLLLDAPDREAVTAAIVAHPPRRQPVWFDQWIDLFVRPDGTPVRLDDIGAIASPQPVLGWGAANAVRRLDISEPAMLVELCRLLKDPDDTVRWRAAHALGPHQDPANLAALQDAFNQSAADSWVAYGLLRAQFEQISNAPAAARGEVVASVLANIRPALSESSLLRSEAVRCLEIDPLPPKWHKQIEPILDYMWQIADDRDAADLAALAGRLRARKGSSADAA